MESLSKRRDTSGNLRKVVLALQASSRNNNDCIKGQKTKTQQEERRKMNVNKKSEQDEKAEECETKKGKRDQGSADVCVEEKRLAFLLEKERISKRIDEALLAVLFGKNKVQKERKAVEDNTKKKQNVKQETAAKQVAKNVRKKKQEESLALLLKKDRKKQQQKLEKESAKDLKKKKTKRKTDQDHVLLERKTKKKRRQQEAVHIARKNGTTMVDDTKIPTKKRSNTRKDMVKGSSAGENDEIQFVLDMPEYHDAFSNIEFHDFKELMTAIGSHKKQFFCNFFVGMPESD